MVYDVRDTGRTGEKRYRVFYKRGTNSNESTNRPAKDLLPPRSSMPYAQCILAIWFTSFNLNQGHRYKAEPWIGSSDLAVVHEVSIVQVVSALQISCHGATCSEHSF